MKVKVVLSLLVFSLLSLLSLALHFSNSPAGVVLAASPPIVEQEQVAPQAIDAPTTLVPSGVYQILLVDPEDKIYWSTPPDLCPPAAAASPDAFEERITRIASYSLGDPKRVLYVNPVTCPNQNIQLRSNLTADANYLYWLSPGALVRYSTNGNPGDVPQVLSNAVGSAPGEVDSDAGFVYVLSKTGRLTPSETIFRVPKAGGTPTPLHNTTDDLSKMSVVGDYLYFLQNGTLRSRNLTTNDFQSINQFVSAYFAEGFRFICLQCQLTHYVYFGMGRWVYRYDHATNHISPAIYTSPEPSAVIVGITSDASNLFIFERHNAGCAPLACYIYQLVRVPRNGGARVLLHQTPSSIASATFDHQLTTDGSFLFWQEAGALKRLPNDAAAMPLVNLFLGKMELTQGIQNENQTVALLQNRKTFARVCALSEETVGNVTAYLYGSWDGGSDPTPVYPSNPNGPYIQMQEYVHPFCTNQRTFLFELPFAWTTKPNLRLKVVLNPDKFPPEPNYADSQKSYGPFNFIASPRLDLQLVAAGYTIGSTSHWPRVIDVDLTLSWLRRAYPIASASGPLGERTPGLRYDVMWVDMPWLGEFVNQSHPFCLIAYPNAKDRVSCATLILNGVLFDWRMEGITPWGIGYFAGPVYYGLISDSGKWVRGQSSIGGLVGSGPAGPSGGWDTDGSYADWYSAHEIGHAIGRKHPSRGNACGHSADDDSYPYPGSYIGPIKLDFQNGFDSGNPAYGIDKRVLPGYIWHDVMGYCDKQWVSDYTYNGFRASLKFLNDVSDSQTNAGAAAITGDFLLVSGAIRPSTSSAVITQLKRVSGLAVPPAQPPGPYHLRLLNAGGNQLAELPFTAVEAGDDDLLTFNLVVNFAPGTRRVQIVEAASGKVLGFKDISASAPTVSQVVMQSSGTPVQGLVTLTWQAADADGDALTYEVLYSRDGGAHFMAIKNGLPAKSTQIDTAVLGGGTAALFRVVASDGANTGFADSPPFVMAEKLPPPRILAPADQTVVRYGQLVNFEGEMMNPKVGKPGDTLEWKNAAGSVLGTGPLLSLANLPAGFNVITLSTVRGQERLSTSITILVDDDIALPGPQLMVSPDSAGWHVAPGETTPLTATIQIDNGGSSALAWTATSSVPWLALSTGGGNTPAELILTASAAGLADGTALVATVTLNASGTGQSIAIPVTLSVGNVWDSASVQLGPGPLYLPIVKK